MLPAAAMTPRSCTRRLLAGSYREDAEVVWTSPLDHVAGGRHRRAAQTAGSPDPPAAAAAAGDDEGEGEDELEALRADMAAWGVEWGPEAPPRHASKAAAGARRGGRRAAACGGTLRSLLLSCRPPPLPASQPSLLHATRRPDVLACSRLLTRGAGGGSAKPRFFRSVSLLRDPGNPAAGRHSYAVGDAALVRYERQGDGQLGDLAVLQVHALVQVRLAGCRGLQGCCDRQRGAAGVLRPAALPRPARRVQAAAARQTRPALRCRTRQAWPGWCPAGPTSGRTCGAAPTTRAARREGRRWVLGAGCRCLLGLRQASRCSRQAGPACLIPS